MTKHTGSVVNDEQRAKCTYVFYIHGAVDLFGSLQIGCRQMKIYSWACINSSGRNILV